MSTEYRLERDLDELERMAERLVDYLLGDALYLSIGAGYLRGNSMPQLTLGALLLRRRRLTVLRSELNAQQQVRLNATLQHHDRTQREWTLHYEKKLRQELPARLKMMRGFFLDCSQNPRDCDAVYPVEALRRSIVQEILLAMDEFGYDKRDMQRAVQQTDGALRRLLHASAFIWSPILERVYPQEVFWWLHSRPGP